VADQHARYATAAEAFLDEATWDGLGYPSALDHAACQVTALRGIGYAVLALEDRLGGLLDAADDSNTQLTEIAGAARDLRPEHRRPVRDWLTRLAWRYWGSWRTGRRQRTLAACPAPPVLSAEDDAMVRRALADAAEWRSRRGEGTGCDGCMTAGPGKCRDHCRDDDLASAYEALRVRRGGEPL
jgi:hypothetical protein